LTDAVELDADAVGDGRDVAIDGIMEPSRGVQRPTWGVM
jgi:hypothetical protein